MSNIAKLTVAVAIGISLVTVPTWAAEQKATLQAFTPPSRP